MTRTTTSKPLTIRGGLLARAVVDAQPLFERFLAGFDESSRTRQAPGLPNHAIWTLGHLGLYLHRGADRVAGHNDNQPLPPDEFADRTGEADWFDPESVCFGSQPVDDPGRYPSLARGIAVYHSGLDHLRDACAGASDELLDRTIAWGSWSMTGEALAMRMVFHVGIHAGQLTDLRRALGMDTIIG